MAISSRHKLAMAGFESFSESLDNVVFARLTGMNRISTELVTLRVDSEIVIVRTFNYILTKSYFD